MKWSVFTLSDIRRVKPRMNALYKTTNDSFTRLLRFQEFYNVEISKSRSVNLEKNSRIFPVYYLQSQQMPQSSLSSTVLVPLDFV